MSTRFLLYETKNEHQYIYEVNPLSAIDREKIYGVLDRQVANPELEFDADDAEMVRIVIRDEQEKLERAAIRAKALLMQPRFSLPQGLE